jgi:hypothetical protein
MADDLPEVLRTLESLQKQKFTNASVTYRKIKKPQGRRDHRAMFKGLAAPWDKYKAEGSRLETIWETPPQIGRQDKVLFRVEEKGVDAGSGTVKIKWTVWDNAADLKNHQMELYGAMRAEHWYIGVEKFKKIASKYFSWVGPETGSENSGIDNFFVKGQGSQGEYVVCESKFTSDVGKFGDWKADKTREKIWKYMTRDKRGGLWPMSWEWIGDRAKLAVADPAGMRDAPEADKPKIRAETKQMQLAVIKYKKKMKRFVNIYGAEKIPIHPGRYQFLCTERQKKSTNILHLQWDLGVNHGEEFIELGPAFDQWVIKDRRERAQQHRAGR